MALCFVLQVTSRIVKDLMRWSIAFPVMPPTAPAENAGPVRRGSHQRAASGPPGMNRLQARRWIAWRIGGDVLRLVASAAWLPRLSGLLLEGRHRPACHEALPIKFRVGVLNGAGQQQGARRRAVSSKVAWRRVGREPRAASPRFAHPGSYSASAASYRSQAARPNL
jgi:hypothetical protein